MASGNQSGALAPFVVHYSRKALVFLFAFGCAVMALGQYALTGEGLGLSYRLAGLAIVPTGVIVMAHAVRYFIAPRIVTILPTGLVYHGMVKTFRAEWRDITKVGAGHGDGAADEVTFHATGPFGIFGKFAINRMLLGGPNGDLATISDALDRAQRGAPLGPQPGGGRQRLR
jgi:hypothetical protein